ncbi:hypothetical protein Tsubulata_039792 [Turnera subulata]|uniref:ACB domain-containing protein n=1 Tax=Turnera subulata TaxID=218843 RepID=A0A9Q0JBL2_9ROSI|nr:hypothetical protein Tsubulata_039792 [Turnera subulata]
MELLRELFVTAVVAILFSFLIAKLVSKAAASGDHQPARDSGRNVDREVKEEIIMEELQFPQRLEVETPETETKTGLVPSAATETVDEFVPVEQVVESAPSPVEITETPLPRSVPESAALSVSAGEETTEGAPGHSVAGESINPEETTETALDQSVREVESGSHGEITVTEPGQAVGDSPVLSVGAGETMETVPGQSVAESDEVETTAAAAGGSVGQPVVESSNSGDITEPVPGQSVGESIEEVSKEAEEKSTEEIGGEDSDQKVKDENLATERESNEKSGVEIDVDDDDDDDWEGIERSELEKEFAEAAKFMESGEKSEGRLGSTGGGNDVQMELYGLHKVATEGPCHEQPPMPLKVSARAKWNAWQRLGNMSPEVAMERYIALVSDQVPGWMEEKMAGAGGAGSSEDANDSVKAPDPRTISSDQPDISDKGDVELESGAKETNLTWGSILEDRV